MLFIAWLGSFISLTSVLSFLATALVPSGLSDKSLFYQGDRSKWLHIKVCSFKIDSDLFFIALEIISLKKSQTQIWDLVANSGFCCLDKSRRGHRTHPWRKQQPTLFLLPPPLWAGAGWAELSSPQGWAHKSSILWGHLGAPAFALEPWPGWARGEHQEDTRERLHLLHIPPLIFSQPQQHLLSRFFQCWQKSPGMRGSLSLMHQCRGPFY